MLTPFPLRVDEKNLTAEDFRRFSTCFKEIVVDLVPTSEEVSFFTADDLMKTDLGLRIQACDHLGDACFIAGSLVFSFKLLLSEVIYAVVEGLDPFVIERSTVDWLEKIKLLIQERFLEIKERRVDLQTGLLNLSSLEVSLEEVGLRGNGALLLIEIPPLRLKSRYGYINVQNATRLLRSFVKEREALHYIGHSVFALLVDADSLAYTAQLLDYLRKEGCRRVHIGVGSIWAQDGADIHGRVVLDRAWTALQEAYGRGPYSFCDYATLACPEQHPLAELTPPLRKKILRAAGKLEKFCLVLLRQKKMWPQNSQDLFAGLDAEQIFIFQEDIYILLPNFMAEQAHIWASDTVARLSAREIVVSAGIAHFPYQEFPRKQVVNQAKKALLHALFYGEKTVTLFDAVSCNVSGDIYYAEGNLSWAAREYRAGLLCDSNNVNLLNSLGVTYVMMGNRLALSCFQEALQSEPQNFMALYNSGLYYRALGDAKKAIDCFEKVLDLQSEAGSADKRLKDISLQLGILCSEEGDGKRALELLLPLAEGESDSLLGDVLYYIGNSYNDVGEVKKAITWLQRAVQTHCLEDRAMSLLGYLYFCQGEGNEVALSLCRRSVEKNPVDLLMKLRLAEVQFACGEVEEALQLARKCLSGKNVQQKARKTLAGMYTDLREYAKARRLLAL